jgi:hypothetical protein
VNGPWILTSAGRRRIGFKISLTSGLALELAADAGTGSGKGFEPADRDCGGGEGAKDERYDRESRAEGCAWRIDNIRSCLSVCRPEIKCIYPQYRPESLLVDHGIISGTVCQSSRQHEGIRLTDCGMIDTAPTPDFAARRARLATCPFRIDRMMRIVTELIDLDKGDASATSSV